jgi:hypothetical protein
VDAARSDPPTPRAQAAARTVQRREQERAAHRKERRIQRWELQEQESEEYRLREQQGLPPSPAMPENSSSSGEEEEESDRGRPPRGGIPHPRHQGPQRRQWSRRPWQVRRHTPPAASGAGTCARRRGNSECRGGAGECYSGDDGRRSGASRTREEEETGLLQFEVSSSFPVHL